MTVLWLKVLHVAAVAIWCAGLIGLPRLYLQRTRTTGRAQLYRLQELVRFFYVALISPAAFVAVGTGAVLIFVAGTFELWFTVKLYLIGALVSIHILTGLVIIRLFKEEQVYPKWRFAAVTGMTLAVVVAILITVLFKPYVDLSIFPQAVLEPGALRRIAGEIIPWVRP